MGDNVNKKFGCSFRERFQKCFGRSGCNHTVSSLSKCARNGRVKVCKVTGDRKICAKMASMGLYPGVEADIICSTGNNHCLLRLNGGTISVDSEISNNVYVTNL